MNIIILVELPKRKGTLEQENEMTSQRRNRMPKRHEILQRVYVATQRQLQHDDDDQYYHYFLRQLVVYRIGQRPKKSGIPNIGMSMQVVRGPCMSISYSKDIPFLTAGRKGDLSSSPVLDVWKFYYTSWQRICSTYRYNTDTTTTPTNHGE